MDEGTITHSHAPAARAVVPEARPMPDELPPAQAKALDDYALRVAEINRQHAENNRYHLEQLTLVAQRQSETRLQFMLLAAGIVGVVVPLLADKPQLAEAWMLRRASLILLLSIAAGAVSQIIRGRLLDPVRRAITADTMARWNASVDLADRRLGELTGQVFGDANVEHEAAIARDKLESAIARLRRRELFEDLLFYGLLLVGLAFLTAALAY